MKPVRFAVVGYGNIAKTHITALRALPILKRLPIAPILDTIVTRRPDDNRQAAAAAGFAHVTDSLEAALADREIEAVDVCTPNALHLEAVRHAAAAHKAVYCEKPLTESYLRSIELTALAEHQILHQVALVYRYHPAILRLRATLANQLIGDVLQFRFAYLRPGYLDASRPLSWRLEPSLTGGGATSDLAVHVLDLVRHLLGEIEQVDGDIHTFVKQRPRSAADPIPVDSLPDDWALMHVRLRNGVRGTAEVSRIAWGADGHFLQLFGTKGSIVCNLEHDTAPTVRLLDGSSPKLPEPAELALLPGDKATMGLAVDCHFGALHHFLLRQSGDERWPDLAPSVRDCLTAEYWIDHVLKTPISRATAPIAE